MKSFINQITTGIGMLTLCLILTMPAYAQQKQGNEKSNKEDSKEENTIHLRIEKFEDGQKKVYEHTYKDGDFDGTTFPDSFMFHSGDSLNSFKFYGKNLLDSITILNPSGKIFLDTLDNVISGKQFLFKHNMDSLLNSSGNMFYHFDHSMMPNIDSLLRKSLDASSFLFDNMDKNFEFHFDTTFNKGFDFSWDNDLFPFKGDDSNLLLNKDEYEIEEIEINGKKMIRITPKKSTKDSNEIINEKKQNNTPTKVQPSDADLNLVAKESSGIVSLRFQVPSDGLTTILVKNSQGKQVYKEKIKNKTGVFSKNIDLSKQEAGVFTIRVQHNGKTISREVTIQ